MFEGLLLEITRYSTEPSDKNYMLPAQKNRHVDQWYKIEDPNMGTMQVTITISYLTKYQNQTLEEN